MDTWIKQNNQNLLTTWNYNKDEWLNSIFSKIDQNETDSFNLKIYLSFSFLVLNLIIFLIKFIENKLLFWWYWATLNRVFYYYYTVSILHLKMWNFRFWRKKVISVGRLRHSEVVKIKALVENQIFTQVPIRILPNNGKRVFGW